MLGGAVNAGSLTTVGTTPVNLNGGTVTTSLAAGQVYNGPVTLGQTGGTTAAPVTTTLAAGAGAIDFAGTVSGNAASTQALTLTTTGTQTFTGAVGGIALASLATGTGPVTLNGGTVTTGGTAGQVFNGPVTLGVDTVLTAANNGGVTLDGAVDSSATGGTTDAHSLAIITGGTTQINAPIGGTEALGSLRDGLPGRRE